MRNFLFTCFILFFGISSLAQETKIVDVIDNLTVRWDQGAINLKSYQGIQEFCLDEDYKNETTFLLDEIHHWDTSLYFIVQRKFEENEDEEAMETLRDIEKLESDYSTINFKNFIENECTQLKIIQDNFDQKKVKQYEKDIRKFEKELVKYIDNITYRIDIIDEHIHHLNLE